jgi:uncharacterized membrane protein HdeD (DUF308 family)
VIVYSIAQQPFAVNNIPSQRSLVWELSSDAVHRAGPAADFLAVYHAGKQERTGANPYQWPAHNPTVPYFFPYRYLPFVGETLGTVLAHFDARTAYLTWLVVLEAVLGVVILVILRSCLPVWCRALLVCSLLGSIPYFLELHMGQFTFLTVSLLLLALLLCDKAEEQQASAVHFLVAALLYATSCLLKIFPLVAGTALIRSKKNFLCLVMAYASVLGFSLPYFLEYPDRWKIFVDWNFQHGAIGMDSGNHSFMYVMTLMNKDWGLTCCEGIWSLIVHHYRLFLLGFTSVVVLLTRCQSVLLGGIAMIFAHFLTYTQVWEHHYSGVAVAGAFALIGINRIMPTIWETQRPKLFFCMAFAFMFLLILPTPFRYFDVDLDPRVWDPSHQWPHYALYLIPLSKVIPLLGLYLITLVVLFKNGFRFPWVKDTSDDSGGSIQSKASRILLRRVRILSIRLS